MKKSILLMAITTSFVAILTQSNAQMRSKTDNTVMVGGESMYPGMHNITLNDATGAIANITTYDVNQSNGVIHVIDRVVMPKM